MAWWQWSQTAASNASADGTINLREGQPPSSVNDSARAMMAAAACYRDDISGSIVTGGTSTAYTVATFQVFDTLAHMDKAMICIVPHVTNGASPTLAADGLTARPIRSAPSTEIGAGVLVQGTPYPLTYNNSDAVFYLHSLYGNPFQTPLGGILPYVGAAAPNTNFALPFGQAISRTTYATLFALTSTTFGAGDGLNTFNLPDLRDLVIAGLGNMGGVDRGLITNAVSGIPGTTMGAAGGAESVTLDTTMIPPHTHTFVGNPLPPHGHTFTGPPSSSNFYGTTLSGAPGPLAGGLSTSNDSAGTPSGTNSNTGGGLAHRNMQPTIMLNYILRVL